jgi:predicted outer membrane repeat protein
MFADGKAVAKFVETVFSDNRAAAGGAFRAQDGYAQLMFIRCVFGNNRAASRGGAIEAGTWVSGGGPNITLLNSSCFGNTAAASGGCLHAEENTTAHLINSLIANNSALAGGGVFLRHFAIVSMVGGTVKGNSAQDGAGLYMHKPARLAVGDVVFSGNAAASKGGAMHVQAGSQLELSTYVLMTGNRAAWGGGVFMLGVQGLNASIKAANVSSNQATFDKDVSVSPVKLSIIGSSVVSGFVSRLGSDQSVLPVQLNVSGPFGLPCDGQLVQALLNGTQVLGVNRSDSSGVVLMRLNIRQPPGLYTIMFDVLSGAGQQYDKASKPPAANLSLQVRRCIAGEVTAAPDACQACPEGAFSLDPSSSSSCDSCPPGAQCPGGFAIVPLPGMWHSAPESPQLHR